LDPFAWFMPITEDLAASGRSSSENMAESADMLGLGYKKS